MKVLFGLLAMLFYGSMSLAQSVLTVVDTNQNPVVGASVLLGYDTGNPFTGNTLTTDSSGTAAVPAGWKAALPVTVQMPGYITTTIPVANPSTMTIQLTPADSATQIEVQGNTTGYGTLVNDGNAHFGLVMPALSVQGMLGFNLSTVMSPQSDALSVLGQTFNIPSNIALPNQTVTYVFPVTLNKPGYASYLTQTGQYLMTIVHGKFPLSTVANGIQSGSSLFDLVNDFTFLQGGTSTINVTGPMTGADMVVNQTSFTSQVAITAPAIPSGDVVLALALNNQNGQLLPTDLKRLTSGQNMNLVSTGTTPSVLSILMPSSSSAPASAIRDLEAMFAPLNFTAPAKATPSAPNFNQVSFAFLPATGGVAPQFLPLLSPPTFTASTNVLAATVPTALSGYTPLATYMVYCQIHTLGSGATQTEQRTRLWEVWSEGWAPQVALPNITFAKTTGFTYRWEVMYLAQPASAVPSSPTFKNGVDLSTVTHVTRNVLAM